MTNTVTKCRIENIIGELVTGILPESGISQPAGVGSYYAIDLGDDGELLIRKMIKDLVGKFGGK